jgi:hypothetical protein
VSSPLHEARWLMRAGARAGDPAALAAAAAPGLDWPRLLALAEFERAFPVVADRLRDAGLAMPDDVAAQVRSRAMVAEFSIARLHAVLEQAVATLAAEGIRVLLLKGAALSRSRYASRRLRPMGDLDLLVQARDATRAQELLVAAGWQTRHDPQLDDFYREHHHLAPMHDPRGAGARLELHVDLFFRGNPFRFGAEQMWRDASGIRVGGADAAVPSAEHLLLHSCVHFAWGHSMREGAWTTFRDVGLLSEAPDLDWERFAAEATASRGATACYWTLRLASRLMDASVPDAILARLAPPLSRVMLERLAHHYATRVLGARRAPHRLERALWELAIAPRRSGHGDVRPWDRDDDFVPTSEAAPVQEPTGARLRRHLRELGDAARCLGELASNRTADRL